jgi:hypothetical protein
MQPNEVQIHMELCKEGLENLIHGKNKVTLPNLGKILLLASIYSQLFMEIFHLWNMV